MFLINGGLVEEVENESRVDINQSFVEIRRKILKEQLHNKYRNKLQELGGGDSEEVCKNGDRYLKDKTLQYFKLENPCFELIYEINFIYRYVLYISQEAENLYKELTMQWLGHSSEKVHNKYLHKYEGLMWEIKAKEVEW